MPLGFLFLFFSSSFSLFLSLILPWLGWFVCLLRSKLSFLVLLLSLRPINVGVMNDEMKSSINIPFCFCTRAVLLPTARCDVGARTFLALTTILIVFLVARFPFRAVRGQAYVAALAMDEEGAAYQGEEFDYRGEAFTERPLPQCSPRISGAAFERERLTTTRRELLALNGIVSVHKVCNIPDSSGLIFHHHTVYVDSRRLGSR